MPQVFSIKKKNYIQKKHFRSARAEKTPQVSLQLGLSTSRVRGGPAGGRVKEKHVPGRKKTARERSLPGDPGKPE